MYMTTNTTRQQNSSSSAAYSGSNRSGAAGSIGLSGPLSSFITGSLLSPFWANVAKGDYGTLPLRSWGWNGGVTTRRAIYALHSPSELVVFQDTYARPTCASGTGVLLVLSTQLSDLLFLSRGAWGAGLGLVWERRASRPTGMGCWVGGGDGGSRRLSCMIY